MKRLCIEDILDKAHGSVYKLSRLASVRALELADGKKALVEKIISEKLSTVALQEIEEGKIELAKES